MLTIRLQRTGRRNDPAFRIVAVEKTASPKAGTYVDLLGTYNPRTKALTVAGDRVKDWVSKGAQLSPSLSNLLIKNSVIEGKLVNVLPKKRPIKKEGAAEAAPAAAPAPEAPAAAAAEEVVAEAAAPEVVAEEPAPAEEAPAPAEEAAPVAEETPAEAPAETPAE